MDEARRERFTALFRWTRPRVIAYVMRRTRSPEDAADAVAETFAIAWRHIDDIPQGEEALLWLYVTARGVLANEWRRSVRRSEVLARVGAALTKTEHPPPDEGRLVAMACLQEMSPDDRELFMLSAWEGLDAAQLGRVLGCSAATARVRLHRARRRLEVALFQSGVRGTSTLTEHPRPDVHCAPEEA